MKKKYEDAKSNQVILVDCEKREMGLYENGNLIRVISSVVLGKNGWTSDKVEGDSCTPLGEFPFGFAFGLEELSISYPYYPITDNVYFVSDSQSEFYNQWVWVGEPKQELSYDYMKTSEVISWQEAEHLCDYQIPYQLGLVIEYNMHPTIPFKGSAIFLHVKNKDYTEGCVAISKEDMLFVLNWLTEEDAYMVIF